MSVPVAPFVFVAGVASTASTQPPVYTVWLGSGWVSLVCDSGLSCTYSSPRAKDMYINSLFVPVFEFPVQNTNEHIISYRKHTVSNPVAFRKSLPITQTRRREVLKKKLGYRQLN